MAESTPAAADSNALSSPRPEPGARGDSSANLAARPALAASGTLIAWTALLFAALALALAGLFPINNPDTYGHLAAGREIVQSHAVPRLDVRSFWRESPQPWANYEWGSALLFWIVYSLIGPNGLLALKLVLLASTGALLVARAREARGVRAAVACALLILAALPVVRFRLTERPHVFGLTLAALYLFALPRVAAADQGPEALRRARGWVVGLSLAHVAWVNLHGSNLLGLLLTLVHLGASLGRRAAARHLGALFGLQLLASCVSPFGPRILFDAVDHVARPEYRALVTEWAPWSPSDSPAYLLALIAQALLLAIVAPSAVREGGSARAAALSATLFVAMGFRSLRFIADSLLLGAPVLGAGLARLSSGWPSARARAIALGAAALALGAAPLGAARLPPGLPFGWGESARGLPVGAGRWLERYAPGARLFAAMEDAWYASFASPSVRVLIDGRVPFYGPAHVRAMARALGSPAELARTLERYRVDAVLLNHASRDQQAVLASMRTATGWSLVYIEDEHALFLRETPARARLLSERSLRVLSPGYDPSPLLDPSLDERAARRELARIADPGAGESYRAWVSALLALRPLARAGSRAGLRAPLHEGERAMVRRAFGWLIESSEGLRQAPATVLAYRALAATVNCDLQAAREGLARARQAGGESRETLLIEQEIALREERSAEVRRFLQRAAEIDGAEGDPWLEALARTLVAPPRCR